MILHVCVHVLGVNETNRVEEGRGGGRIIVADDLCLLLLLSLLLLLLSLLYRSAVVVVVSCERRMVIKSLLEHEALGKWDPVCVNLLRLDEGLG